MQKGMAKPSLKESLSERRNAVIQQLKHGTFTGSILRVLEYFEVRKSLTVKDKRVGAPNRVVTPDILRRQKLLV